MPREGKKLCCIRDVQFSFILFYFILIIIIIITDLTIIKQFGAKAHLNETS